MIEKGLSPVRKLIRAFGSLLTIFALTVSVSGQAPKSNSQDVISQTRAAYYNVGQHGFYGFEAALDPKWEIILGSTATAENLKIFRSLRFAVSVDAKGAATVTQVVLGAKTTRVEPYIKQVQYNIQRLVSAVMGTWATFMVNSPFPDDRQIKLEQLANGYHLFYSMESREVSATLTNDLLITEWQITDARARRTINPVFQKTPDGFLLSGYHSVFSPFGEGNRTTLDIKIDYQVVSRMRLPRKILLKGTYGNEPIEAELTLHSVLAERKP
jgi:hypothetical protein